MRVKLAAGAGKTAELDGTRLPSAESLRREFPTLVFTPDRLAVVKGGPAVRRAYLDRALARLSPTRSGLPQDYAAALAQRNAALRRVQLGLSAAGRRRAVDGARRRSSVQTLVEARRETAAALEPGFRAHLAGFGLPGGRLVLRRRPAVRARPSRPASTPTSPAGRRGSGRISTTS